MFDDDTLDSDAEMIDKSNEYARTKNQFKQGNTQGVRFASSNKDQISTDDTDSNQSTTPSNNIEV